MSRRIPAEPVGCFVSFLRRPNGLFCAMNYHVKFDMRVDSAAAAVAGASTASVGLAGDVIAGVVDAATVTAAVGVGVRGAAAAPPRLCGPRTRASIQDA